jgi:hypothetical protein
MNEYWLTIEVLSKVLKLTDITQVMGLGSNGMSYSKGDVSEMVKGRKIQAEHSLWRKEIGRYSCVEDLYVGMENGISNLFPLMNDLKKRYPKKLFITANVAFCFKAAYGRLAIPAASLPKIGTPVDSLEVIMYPSSDEE